MTKTKNIGQVVGLFIGKTPPSNTSLIWYDEASSQRYHKVYNPATNLWEALNPDIISVTTYSELVNTAQVNGLSIGKQYQIRDKDDTWAIAITPTKIQYIDRLGNILIDDLGSNVQYHVSHGNILIDDIHGVMNESSQLIFSFSDETPNVDTDYVLGKSRIGNAWRLAKFSFRKLLSSVSGNSISWKNGFFFNFSDAIKSILDKSGGVVSKDAYDKKIKELDTAIGNASKENQNIVNNASDLINKAVTDKEIYEKRLPINIDTSIAPGDIQIKDTLSSIVSKIQRWINQFKYATGIRISMNFSDAKKAEFINNNDTVESALGKLQFYIQYFTLPKSFDSDEVKDKDKLYPASGDKLYEVSLKLKYFLLNLLTRINDSGGLIEDFLGGINKAQRISELKSTLLEILAQIDYNQWHINSDMLKDYIIGYSKIAKDNVYPTDIFKVYLYSNQGDYINNVGFGAIVNRGNDNTMFQFSIDPNYKHELYDYVKNPMVGGGKGDGGILAFTPVVWVGDSSNFSINAAPLIKTSGNVTLQLLLHLKQTFVSNCFTNKYDAILIKIKGAAFGREFDFEEKPAVFLLQPNTDNVVCPYFNIETSSDRHMSVIITLQPIQYQYV